MNTHIKAIGQVDSTHSDSFCRVSDLGCWFQTREKYCSNYKLEMLSLLLLSLSALSLSSDIYHFKFVQLSIIYDSIFQTSYLFFSNTWSFFKVCKIFIFPIFFKVKQNHTCENYQSMHNLWNYKINFLNDSNSVY